jgi:hypothetical protein
MHGKIQIDEGLRDRLADGRILPVVDASSNDKPGQGAQSRCHALARLLSPTGVPAVVAYRDPRSLHSALATSDDGWQLADGYDVRAPSGTRFVLSPGEVGAAASWEDAWLQVEHRQPVLWELMSSYAARFPLLLFGTDPQSGALQDLVARLRPHRYFTPSGWIVAESIAEDVAHRWQELGLTVVSLTDEAFIRTYTEELNLRSYSAIGWMSDGTDQMAPSPFKLLDYYDVQDAPIFYARHDETDSLLKLVTSNRLVIVTGPSGAGKTSLLKAGLIAHINRLHPYRGLYVRFMEDPVGELLAALERELAITTQRPSGRSAPDWREMWQVIDREDSLPVVIFDQGEELFTRFESTMRDDLFSLIIDAVVHPRSRSRFVIGIREDYLSYLAEFAGQLPGILQTSFYVGALTKKQAHEAIRRPFEDFGIRLEAGLEIQIADEIGTDRVASPQIQIVCDRLFSARKSDSIGLEDYQRLGGTKGILGEFLNDQLHLLDENRADVVEILKSLVTSEGTKDVLSLEELSERSAVPPALTERLIDHLTTKSRLLRPVSGRSGVRYELAHEYLTHEIWQWMSPAEISRREAQELIAADLRAWTTFDSLRLGVDRLDRYYKHVRDLKIDENVGTLLLLSSVRHSRPHAVWVEAISRLHPSVQTRVAWSLLRFIATRSNDQRFEAAEAMASLGSDVVVSALSAAERDIRHAALYMAAGLGLSSAQPVLIEALENAEDERSEELACLALGEIGGQGAVEALIPRASSTSVRVAAAAVRGLGSCLEEVAFPYLTAALWGDQPEMIRAAQLGIAAAVSVEFSTYLADTIGTNSDVNGRPISLSSKGRLIRILEGFDHARVGDEQLLAPLAHLIRADSIETDQFSTPWLLDGLKRIKTDDAGSDKTSLEHIKEKFLSADDVVAALEKYRENSVAIALANGRSKSLPILRELSSHDSDQVRLTILMALWRYKNIQRDPVWRTYIRPSLLVRGLQDEDPGIRYYACLAVENLRLIECVPFLRLLTRDDARGHWWVVDVGKRVSDAAHMALDSLRPESSVWRKDWQLEARPL